MEAATDHDSMVRAQAKAQLLRLLCSDTLERNALARHQTATVSAQPYMGTDFMGEETTQ